ncbi:MAG: SagB/ThcOx family dehydrogenase [Desulfosarcina sp.]|jgi:SagB-type dehydrogenase family enzyme
MSQPTLSAADYHRATSYRRHALTPHSLDWTHQPLPAKRYPNLPRVPLDRRIETPQIDYFNLVKDRPTDPCRSGPPDLREITMALQLTHAVTARSVHAGQPFYYRSVASAGALYPFELYLAAYHVDGLAPGVYHFDLFDFCLNTLRGDAPPEMPPAEYGIAATFFITGIYFRSAWKYRSRAYRYVLLDAGHLLENLRLALGALNRDHRIHFDFDDHQTATLLGLDPDREGCLVSVHLPVDHSPKQAAGAADACLPLADDIRRASIVSDREVAYAEILAIHRSGHPVGTRSVDSIPVQPVGNQLPVDWINVDTPDHPEPADYLRVLAQRRSRRNFVPETVSRLSFMALLDLLLAAMDGSSGIPVTTPPVLSAGLLAGQHMPIAPGFYRLDPGNWRLGRLLDGRLIEPMASACLDQMWLKHAGLHLLFTVNLAALDRDWGARGYRYAMLEAGRLGQQAYLAATALGWGACGIGAIYDREAADLLDLEADEALLYLVGVGPVKTR